MAHAESEPLGRRRDARPSRARPTLADVFSVADRAERVGRYWWLLLLTGIAWIVVAAILFRFDYTSVVAVATLFGVVAIAVGTLELGLAAVVSFYFIFAGAWDVVSSLSMRSTPSWWIQLVSGLVELGLGYWAAGSWRISASLLVAFVAAIALIRGVTQISLAFSIHNVREGLSQR